MIYSGTGIKLLSQGIILFFLYEILYLYLFSAPGLAREEVVKSIQYMYENREKYTKASERIAVLMKEAGGAKTAADIAERIVSLKDKN